MASLRWWWGGVDDALNPLVCRRGIIKRSISADAVLQNPPLAVPWNNAGWIGHWATETQMAVFVYARQRIGSVIVVILDLVCRRRVAIAESVSHLLPPPAVRRRARDSLRNL